MTRQATPLAERLRPASFDEMVGQERLFGENGAIRRILDSGYLPNMVFYGPPGTGKTTAAEIIARGSDKTIRRLNATTASLADVKSAIADTSTLFGSGGILLYLDEIQYFNKKQQQTLLEYMEDGRVTLIASTTENPYLYVYAAVLSRSSVFEFLPVAPEEMLPALRRGLSLLRSDAPDAPEPREDEDDLLYEIASRGAGDVRRALNLLEQLYAASGGDPASADISLFAPKAVWAADKSGTAHYDLLSALQKSIRGSDPDAAVFYLARILESGDLPGAVRRLQVIASEDIGLAYPLAAVVTRACCESAKELGMPEATVPLSHAAVLLATSPKSNTAYLAYAAAKADIEAGLGQQMPPYLRPSNSFDGYKYPHDFENRWVEQRYLPYDLGDKKYYEYGDCKNEQAAKAYWEKIKKK
jgi:putative ATPase